MTKKINKLLIGSIVALLALGFIVLPKAAQAAPEVVFTNPGNGQTGISLDSNIYFVFSEPMNPATLDASTVLVSGSASGQISAASIELIKDITCRFDPSSNFIAGETVTATVTEGAGLASNYTISFTVKSDVTDPEPPTNLVAQDKPNDNGGSISLSWQASASSDAFRYIIYRSSNSAGPYGKIEVIGNTTSYVDNSVGDNVDYYYKVRTQDLSNNQGGYSNAAKASAKENIPPSSVTGVKATSSDGKVILSWTNPQDPDLAGVRILRKTTGCPDSIYDGQVIYKEKSTSYEDAGLENGVTYYYTLYAYDASDNYSSGASIKAAPKKASEKEIPDEGEPRKEEEPKEEEPKQDEPKEEEPKQEQEEEPKEETPPTKESPEETPPTEEVPPTEEAPQEETPAPTPFSIPAPIIRVVEKMVDSPSAPSESEGEVAGEETDVLEEAIEEEPAEEEEISEEVSEEKKEGLLNKAKATLISFFKPKSLPLTIIIVMFAVGIGLYLFSYKRKKRIIR